MRSLVLAALLLLLPTRRLLAEDRVDLTMGYYIEDHQRVEVWSPALLWETDVNPSTVVRLQGTYDVVSGASPTGAPLQRKIKSKTIETTSKQTSTVITGYDTVSSPSGFSSTSVPIYSVVPAGGKIRHTVLAPYGKPFLPMASFHDQRLGLNLEVEHHSNDWIYTAGAAFGNESDYQSLAGTVKVARDFNQKTTQVGFGASYGHDWVLNPTTLEWDGKDTLDSLITVSQIIDPKTLVTLSTTLGTTWGYLDDQYKYASVNDVIVHERRPDARDRRIAMLMLNHTFDSLHGSVEASYRYYNDSYGINASTLGLTWFQHLGKYLILAPDFRYYEQSAADFYAVSFTGNPAIFSSDYRLSKLSSITYGLKALVKISEKFNFTVAYDRYSMWGRDGVTAGEAYPKANIFTAGFKLWY